RASSASRISLARTLRRTAGLSLFASQKCSAVNEACSSTIMEDVGFGSVGAATNADRRAAMEGWSRDAKAFSSLRNRPALKHTLISTIFSGVAHAMAFGPPETRLRSTAVRNSKAPRCFHSSVTLYRRWNVVPVQKGTGVLVGRGDEPPKSPENQDE